MIKLKPRNDWVIVKIINVDETESGIKLPQVSIEGKRFIVEAIGHLVDDLNVGDSVMMTGQIGVQYFPLPNRKDMIAIKQENIVFREVEE